MLRSLVSPRGCVLLLRFDPRGFRLYLLEQQDLGRGDHWSQKLSNLVKEEIRKGSIFFSLRDKNNKKLRKG